MLRRGGVCSIESCVQPFQSRAEVSQVLVSTSNNYSLPPLAQQLNCATGPCLIDTGDTRVSGEAIYASGSLYAAIDTNGTGAGAGASHFLWFQIRPVLNDNDNAACTGTFQNRCPQIIAASILNEVCWACATGQGDNGTGATFYPEVQPDPEGNVLVVFNYSADDKFPSSAYATNRATQAPGTMHDSGFFLQHGLAKYELLDTSDPTNPINRWGITGGLARPNAGDAGLVLVCGRVLEVRRGVSHRYRS